MKKIIFAFFCVTISYLSVYAGSEIKITQGQRNVLNENLSIPITFNWEGATWDNRLSLKEQLGADYDANIESAQDAFITEFNKIKGCKLVEKESDSEYSAVFEIQRMDGHMGVGLKVGWESLVWGTFTIYKNNELILEIKISKFEGPKDLSRDDSIAKVFKKLASKIKK